MSTKAMGRAIRTLREEADLSQQELGERAGYSKGAGAGVSMSRVEAGRMRPGPAKLGGIAHALGVSLELLAETAEQLVPEVEAEDERATREAAASPRPVEGSTSGLPLKQRLPMLQTAIDRRIKAVEDLSDRFNAEHDRARDDFFVPFIVTAQQVRGAPRPPEPAALGEEELADPDAVADYRLTVTTSRIANNIGATAGGAAVGSAVGGAAAYGTFTAAAMFGTASTGAALSGLQGAAATSATYAFLGGGSLAAGGAGVAGGVGVLAGIVAAPAALLAVAGYVWMSRRNKQKEREAHARLDAVEVELLVSERGYEALLDAIAGAADLLDYIATHAGHAQGRWSKDLGPDLPVEWADLTAAQRDQYDGFLSIAACQISVANLNFAAFSAVRDGDLDDLIRSTKENLTHARETVSNLV
ncbi:helix-turn-helix transcriptional regulator [Nocardioides sp. zg-1308]|uniref:helix-turn-helix domain-containing protein n=1 Tax=Nocardioides sp. zg-1308 TaxID=2736253 RepID=UPI0015516B6E|nr:helix-turn-helix transcriptional regulator [Nocardioides sp. zg-1308]